MQLTWMHGMGQFYGECLVTDIKPCPFCGNESDGPDEDFHVHVVSRPDMIIGFTAYVECRHCFARGMQFYCEETEIEAVEAAIGGWNQGDNPNTIRAVIAFRFNRMFYEPIAWVEHWLWKIGILK